MYKLVHNQAFTVQARMIAFGTIIGAWKLFRSVGRNLVLGNDTVNRLFAMRPFFELHPILLMIRLIN